MTMLRDELVKILSLAAADTVAISVSVVLFLRMYSDHASPVPAVPE
jgi:hypothetical protein